MVRTMDALESYLLFHWDVDLIPSLISSTCDVLIVASVVICQLLEFFGDILCLLNDDQEYEQSALARHPAFHHVFRFFWARNFDGASLIDGLQIMTTFL